MTEAKESSIPKKAKLGSSKPLEITKNDIALTITASLPMPLDGKISVANMQNQKKRTLRGSM
jgi:hypothetical protein